MDKPIGNTSEISLPIQQMLGDNKNKRKYDVAALNNAVTEFNKKINAERLDEVDNAIHNLCKVMLQNDDLNWNIEMITEIGLQVARALTDRGFDVWYPAHDKYSNKKED